MLRKIFVLTLLLCHFGEFSARNFKNRAFHNGPQYTFYEQTTFLFHRPYLSIAHKNQPQGNSNPSPDKTVDRIGNDENQAAALNADSYFVNNQTIAKPQPSQPIQYQASNQNQQPTAGRPQQQQPIPYPASSQNQQPTAGRPQQQPQPISYPAANPNQQNDQQQPIAYPAGRPQQSNSYPVINQNQQTFGASSSSSSFQNQAIPLKKEKVEPTTYRYPSKFDRTSMMSSEEFTQKPDQRPNYDSFGDGNNKNNQDETFSTYPSENPGNSRDQVPMNKQNVYIEHFNRPDENAIVIPNMPSKVVEIIFPPTLSYDEDSTTTTRASIFDSMRRRATTTESYNTASYQ